MIFPKLYVCGHARHGKDTVSDLLCEKLGYAAIGSSWIIANDLMFDLLKDRFGYRTIMECFNDRHRSDEMRALWFDEIHRYNEKDLTRLSRLIFSTSNIYTGIRNDLELLASQKVGLADHYIWVDATGRGLPLEPITSMRITEAMMTYTVKNDGSLDDLSAAVDRCIADLKLPNLKW